MNLKFCLISKQDGTKPDTYLELEFGPHSHHLALFLNGRKKIIEQCLPIQYEAKIGETVFSHVVIVQEAILPNFFYL